MIPESEVWLAHAEYIENTLLEAQQNGGKVRKYI